MVVASVRKDRSNGVEDMVEQTKCPGRQLETTKYDAQFD